MQKSNSVIIKGVREGLLLLLDDDVPFSQILTELSERMGAQPDFFRGAGIVINAGSRIMDRPDFDVLYRMLTRNGMLVQSFVSTSAQSRMVAEGFGVTSRPPSFAAGDAGGSLGLRSRGTPRAAAPQQAGDSTAEAGIGLFLRCTLRAGQSVKYAGDVCVLGDVEAGAEIVADGDVVVWGALRGAVYAGSSGDDEAVVCALHMVPTQVGIAGTLSRFPSQEASSAGVRPPELARLEEGRIVVEGWHGDAESSTEGAGFYPY